MYSQSMRGRTRRGGAGHIRSVPGKKTGKERVRLIQLAVCLALFLTVFIGKGVFPQRLHQVSGQLLALMGQNTDFRGAFSRLGESLAKEESVLGEIGDFCIQVFGPSNGSAPVLMPEETENGVEQMFLNSAPDQAALMAHYLRMEEVPEEWFKLTEEQAEPEETVVAEEEIPAVGVVVLQADYHGTELPEGYTMDQLSLGGLETVTPVMGTLRSEYGYRDHPIDGSYKFHNGVDIGADQGKEIGAFAAGTVEYVGESDAYGNYLQIDHGQGIKSFYAHCSELCVKQGQVVAAGERIALVGATGNATGPHLHFELKCGGLHIDPAYYIEYKTP